MNFSNHLIAWYLKNKRDLPWRNTTNAYHIWLSEIILQQTRVEQGLPYYNAFILNFRTIIELANASENEILKLWQGLGYYSRARNLHFTAKYIAFELNGKFPDNYVDLLKLKGIGTYTAAAIASFCNNEIVPVVDGNVFRVLSRFFGNTTNISNSNAKKIFFTIAESLIPKNNPAVFNQAIMEFGALQCVPKKPNCGICVFQKNCIAFNTNQIEKLPVNLKKIKIKKRYLNYFLVIDSQNKSIINKRTEKGIWQNLYELPCIETDNKTDDLVIKNTINQQYSNVSEIIYLETENKIHKLSHQHLYIQFWKVHLKNKLVNSESYLEIIKNPFPIVIHNFLKLYPF